MAPDVPAQPCRTIQSPGLLLPLHSVTDDSLKSTLISLLSSDWRFGNPTSSTLSVFVGVQTSISPRLDRLEAQPIDTVLLYLHQSNVLMLMRMRIVYRYKRQALHRLAYTTRYQHAIISRP